MALDRNKVLAVAQKHLSKGNFDKAIAEYRRLVEEDPRDVRTWLKIGDLYTRKGDRKEATETYGKVAEHYAAGGFFLKAVAVYKQILKLDPSRLDVSLRLGEMYEQLQLTTDALNTYEHVAATFARAGDMDRALQTLGKMTELEPDNIPVRIKLAEALSKAGKTPAAAGEFEKGADLLKAQGRIDDYMKVAERLLYHRPEDLALARELATLYLERSDAKRALAKLQACFKANPRDVATLGLLAQAFHQLGQTPKTISVYREVARLHQEANRPTERMQVLERILALDPADPEARQALGAGGAAPPRRERSQMADMPPGAVVESMPPPAGGQGSSSFRQNSYAGAPPASARGGSHGSAPLREPSAAARPPLPPMRPDVEPDLEPEYLEDDVAIEEEEDSADILIVDEEEPVEASELVAADQATQVPSVSPSVPPEVALEAKVARLLTEVEVFARYGLKAKIIDQLEQAVELAPTHVEAREKLKDAYIDGGRSDDAIDQLRALADIFLEDRVQLAQLYIRQILEIDSENLYARHHLRHSMVPGAPDPAPAQFEEPTEPGLSASDEPPPPAHDHDDGAEDDVVLFVDDADELVPGPEAPSASELTRVTVAQRPAARRLSEDGAEGPSTAEVPIPSLRGSDPGPHRRAAAHGGALGYAPPEQHEPAQHPSAEYEPAQAAQGQAELPVAPDAHPGFDAPPEGYEGFDAPPAEPPPYDAGLEPSGLAPMSPEEFDAAPVEPPPYDAELEPAGLAPMSPEEFDAAPLSVPAATPSPESVPAADGSPGEVEEILDEADFYVDQGLYEEACDTLRDALEAHPGHPLLADKLAEVEAAAEAAAAPQAQAAPQAGPSDSFEDETFALAEKLAEELDAEGPAPGSDVLDIDSVFAQFKKGVEEQIDPSDSETHYDLGIAYKEMGLVDDAIQEFRLAMANPERECIAQTMIGMCHLEQGNVAEAIAHFEKGLASERKSAREQVGLFFELGSAHELQRDTARALHYFHQVERIDPTFRGIKERVKTLTANKSAAPRLDPVDEVDQAFDDLFGDD